MRASLKFTAAMAALSLSWFFVNGTALAPLGALIAVLWLIRRQRHGYVDYTPSMGEVLRTERLAIALCAGAAMIGCWVLKVGPELTMQRSELALGFVLGVR
jgi:hypothetical protein